MDDNTKKESRQIGKTEERLNPLYSIREIHNYNQNSLQQALQVRKNKNNYLINKLLYRKEKLIIN